jgi:hypothetical protein
LTGTGKLSQPFSNTVPHSFPSSQHRTSSFTTSLSAVAVVAADDVDVVVTLDVTVEKLIGLYDRRLIRCYEITLLNWVTAIFV